MNEHLLDYLISIDCSVEVDNHGQLVIYTGKKWHRNEYGEDELVDLDFGDSGECKICGK